MYDGESNFLVFLLEILQDSHQAERSYCKRLEQYVRAARTSASTIFEGFAAGVLYDVAAYVRLKDIGL